MSKYQKLIDVNAIWKPSGTPVPDNFYNLEIPDSLPNGGLSQIIFVDMVFQAIAIHNQTIPMPDAVAMSLGKSRISFDEYLKHLRTGGFDVDALLMKTEAAEASLNASIADRRTRAAAFFELIQTQWIVDDEDVKKHIDGQSIYDLLELVLEHADSTRARLKAIKKHASDPKQADKALVRECWDDWQKQPERYDGKAAFARDMLLKYESLKSQPVIEGWCRLWERET